jgi:hypothetical protein
MENNQQMEMYYPGCMDNNKQMKLYSHGGMDNNRQMKLYYPTQGNTTPFVFIIYALDPGENSFISLFFPYTQCNTASFVCYFHTHRAIQLHIFAIVHTHSASFVCYLPNNQDNMVQLHLFVIVYTHRGIETNEAVFPCVYGK